MKTLLFERNLPRFAAARVASSFGPGRGAGVGPLRLVDTDPLPLPNPDWVRVTPRLSGICGSDLATVDGRASRYFEEIVSFPFVPGHEVVGTVTSLEGDETERAFDDGTRVVVEPVLSCVVRGIDPMCAPCAAGHTGNCEQIGFGHLRPGLQTGYCTDTGGGWSAAGLVAHRSQLHAVPGTVSDEEAVTVEPLACAVHAAMTAGVREGDTVAVVGAGTVGLSVTGALSHLAATGRLPAPDHLVVGARYPHQRRLALELGATEALGPEQLAAAVRRRSRSLAVGTPGGSLRLTGGADVVLDCVGSAESIAQSLAMVRPRGRVALVGMPGRTHVDLAPLWHREISLAGAYAYGLEEPLTGPPVRTFDLAFEVATAKDTGRLVTAAYPLERFEEAVRHAGSAGRRGAVKIAFDLRGEGRTTKGTNP